MSDKDTEMKDEQSAQDVSKDVQMSEASVSEAGVPQTAASTNQSDSTMQDLAASETKTEGAGVPRKTSSIKDPDEKPTSIYGKVDKSESEEEEEKKVFKGLGNQGATCYMNSCL